MVIIYPFTSSAFRELGHRLKEALAKVLAKVVKVRVQAQLALPFPLFQADF